MTSVLITQSNYIPWKGYFDQIRAADQVVLYDDAQFTRRDWRNRNKIKTVNGTHWLTIPVEVKGKFSQKIKDTKVADRNWSSVHWKSIKMAYSKASFFDQYQEVVGEAYSEVSKLKFLSEINQRFIEMVCVLLDIPCNLSRSSDYNLLEGKTDRLIGICQQMQASTYLSGPAAKDYLEEYKFLDSNIELKYFDFSDYPRYPQLHGEFEHSVTILDLLFNVGPEALNFMKADCLAK